MSHRNACLCALIAVFAVAASSPPATPTGGSLAIKVDQVGYLPGMPKIALVTPDAGSESSSFRILRPDGSIAYQGTLSAATSDPDSGDNVRQADFSALNETGRFVLEAPGAGRSWSFQVTPDAFTRAYYLAMRSYYGQRCTTAVDMGPGFPAYKHGACHLDGAFHASSGKTGRAESVGGWHDAGDYGRYVVNSGISTGTILWAYEIYGVNIGKVSLQIPESGNGAPDILNEARWNMKWMLSMQDTDGGVWHKQTSDHFAPFIMPEADKLVSYVIGTGHQPFKSSCATADTAAVMAIGARLFKPYDAAFAQTALKSAESAWKWVQANPNVTFQNPPGVSTGEYGDRDCSDERLWASAELWRTTHNAAYSEYFLAHYRDFLDSINATNPQSWSMVAPLGLWTYALGAGTDSTAVAEIRKRTLQSADQVVNRTNANGYHVSLAARDYIWGSNGVAANYSMQLLIADQFQHAKKYVDAAADNIHYILGRNTFSLSWVTQLGEHPFLHPHHRPSAADGIELPWPGLMSGGPNPGRQDAAMKKLVPAGLPPARAYIDETAAYACNEVAINWNAPLVFALSAMVPASPAGH